MPLRNTSESMLALGACLLLEAPLLHHLNKYGTMLAQALPPKRAVTELAVQKNRRLEACLVEGIKILDRRFVSSPGAVMGLTRDERHQRLLLQFRGCNDDLQVRNGILGQAKHFGTGSSNIVAATKKVFEQFCTPMCKAPMREQDFIITKNNDIKQ